jgi:hypothetical protein
MSGGPGEAGRYDRALLDCLNCGGRASASQLIIPGEYRGFGFRYFCLLAGDYCGFDASRIQWGQRSLVYLAERRVQKACDDRQLREALFARVTVGFEIKPLLWRVRPGHVSDHQVSCDLFVLIFTGRGDVQYIPRFPVADEEVKA